MDRGGEGSGRGEGGWTMEIGKMEYKVLEEERCTRDNETDRSDLSLVGRGGRQLDWSGVFRSLRAQGGRGPRRGGSSVCLISEIIFCL